MEGIGLMKKVLLSLAAVSAIAVAVPAAAQPAYRYANVDARAINAHQADLAQRIDRAFRNHRISRAEANRLMAELRKIEALEHRYRAGGLNRWERDQLEARLDRLQAQLRQERRDDNRHNGSGYGHR
jgi:Skp family chaperone for outer membrane proteins